MAKEKNPECVKRGRSSKRKGAAGEREAARKLQEVFPGIEAHRGRQYHGGPGTPDVCLSLEGLHLEVKRTETFSPYTAMKQAEGDAKGAIPMVLHRKNHGDWMCFVHLRDLPGLVKLLATSMDLPDMRELYQSLVSSIINNLENPELLDKCPCGKVPEVEESETGIRLVCSCGKTTDWHGTVKEAKAELEEK